MREISKLRNRIQEYEWGSRTALPELLGRPASTGPQAELWMGAHPRASSLVEYEGRWVPLIDLIERFPGEILGKESVEKFGVTLPFLFKVLAAAKPLSIQVHPNRGQAARGFEEENERDVPMDSPSRNYHDANHKPECLCALTPFRALSGFREIPEMISLMKEVCLPGLEEELASFQGDRNERGLKRFFTALMTMGEGRKKRIIDEALIGAESAGDGEGAFGWMIRLSEEFPGDIGILSPLLLNLVCLRPGEAVYLPAGRLHSYLGGTGIELMANSDNVLRGGLTPKHVDLPELLRIVNFSGGKVMPIPPEDRGPSERVYPTPADEFSLTVITVGPGEGRADFLPRSAEIIVCTEGKATLLESRTGRAVEVRSGASVLVPAAAGRYCVEGDATLYRASVPVPRST